MDNIQKDKYFMNAIAFRLKVQKKKDGLWNCKCPINGCDDKNNKMRFFFVARKDHILAYCHDCGYSTNLKSFIKQKFPELLDEYKFYSFGGFSSKTKENKINASSAIDIKAILKTLKAIEKTKATEVTSIKLHGLTTAIKELPATHPARRYTERRLIPWHLVRYTKDFYQLTQALEQTEFKETFKKYQIPGLVVPFYNDIKGTVKILQTRFFDPKVLPKYLTIKLDDTEPKVYNKYNIDSQARIYILEGPIDSMFCRNSIAMAGSDVQVDYKDQVWVYDNEPDNDNINKKMLKKIQEGQQIVIWKRQDNFKDINDGLMSGEIKSRGHVDHILQERTVQGLRARLSFAKYRG